MRPISTFFFLLFLIFSPLKTLAAPPQEEKQLAASIEVLNPGVEVLRGDTEEWLVITGKAVVAQGDRVRTDEEGEALITWFADGTVMDVQPASEILINEFNADSEETHESFTVNATVSFGQVINSVNRIVNVKSEYRLNTSALQAAVRGTVFSISVSEDQETLIVVVEGTVVASQNELEVEVHASEFIEVTASGALLEATQIEGSTNPEITEIFEETEQFEEEAQDTDADGVVDLVDACPDEAGSSVYNGCSEPQEVNGDDNSNGDNNNGEDDCEIDSDGDGVSDCEDEDNAECEDDTDNDGIPDCEDDTNDCEIDSDGDGVSDCEDEDNAECEDDTDNDGIPDCEDDTDDCEIDSDGDGTPDCEDDTDDCSIDSDGDGIPDCEDDFDDCSIDSDGDGTPDCADDFDDCSVDSDNDGIPDCDDDFDDCSVDSDNDGIPDCEDDFDDCSVDSDNDGIPDCEDDFDDCSVDSDNDGIPDCEDPD